MRARSSSEAATDPFTVALTHRRDLTPRLRREAMDEAELISAIVAEIREFCVRHVDSARIDREGRLGQELLTAVAQRGWFGLTIPAEHGGAALSLAAATRVVTELACHDGSLGTCVGLHNGLALHALLHVGSLEARHRYLRDAASGRRIAAFAATEPEAGSDIAAVKTTLRQRGTGYVLDGGKCYVTNGGLAGLFTVLAKSPGLGGARAGHTLVLVDGSAPGLSRSGEENKLGLKGSSTVSVFFDGVEVPADHVLGLPSQGLVHAHGALSWGRTFLAAGCLGSARAALAIAREHCARREQFGRPLERFPLVRDALTEADAELLAVESTLRLVTALYDARCGDLALPSTLLKVLASESAWAVIDSSLQLMGGAGYMEENGIARRLRDVRITRIFEGANDVLRVSVAAATLTWQTSGLADLRLGATSAFAAEADAVASELRALAQTVDAVRQRHGFRLFGEQRVSADLATAITHGFAALAVLLRANAEEDVTHEGFASAMELCLRRARAARESALARGD